jgi:hypothetical protein
MKGRQKSVIWRVPQEYESAQILTPKILHKGKIIKWNEIAFLQAWIEHFNVYTYILIGAIFNKQQIALMHDFVCGSVATVGLGNLIIEVSGSHSDT